MKQTMFAVVLSLALISCGSQDADTNSQETNAADVTMAKIAVPTIQCASCANNVKQAVVDLPGMQEAKVDLKEKIVSVHYQADMLSLAQIETAIANAGYDANQTKRNPEAHAELDACCQIPESDKQL